MRKKEKLLTSTQKCKYDCARKMIPSKHKIILDGLTCL